jgi:RimJ/RimL family protein N-acetyltransferase
MRLVAASPNHSRLLWEWRNDALSREASLSSEPISWETHESWFARRLADSETRIVVAYIEAPVGCVRIQSGAVSIMVAPEHRGFGHASRMLEMALVGEGELKAEIKDWNRASIRVFERCGFAPVETRDGVTCYLRRP